MEKFNWKCPYCGFAQVVLDERYHRVNAYIDNDDSEFGPIAGLVTTIVCANEDCKKMDLSFTILQRQDIPHEYRKWEWGETVHEWNLLPESNAKPQPDYIPEAIRENYREACRIRDLSAKASATLSRRCLQGIIRNFWGVKGQPNLWAEIQAIKDNIDPQTWEAIDAIRKVGKIGAHMEKDVNIIIDVEPEEAQLLIGLIEMLFEDWYVARYNREQRVAATIALGKQKQELMDAMKKKANEGDASGQEAQAAQNSDVKAAAADSGS